MLAGVDLAHEEFNNYTLSLPTGVVLNKNDPRTTSARRTAARWVDEALRIEDAQPQLRRQGARRLRPGPGPGRAELEDARRRCAGTTSRATTDLSPRDARPSRRHASPSAPAPTRSGASRVGVLYQPSDAALVPRLVRHVVQHLGRHLPVRRPELEHAAGEEPRTSSSAPSSTCSTASSRARAAIFRTDQVQRAQPRLARRRRRSTTTCCRASATRSGVELDVAGRITPAWEVYAVVRVDPDRQDRRGRQRRSTPTGELVGQRPSLTPRHSGSLLHDLPGHAEAAPRRRPQRAQLADAEPQPGRASSRRASSPATCSPSTRSRRRSSLKLNVINVTNKLYADSLYTGALHSRSAANRCSLR